MTSLEHTSFDKQKQTEKIAEKHPAFKDKSDDIKKSGNSWKKTYAKLYVHNNIPQILVYIMIL